MSRRVDVPVPAVVRHIPRGSRSPRTSYAPVVASVELRELSRADAPRGPDLPVNGGRIVATRLVGGEAYRGIGSYDPFGEIGKVQSNVPSPDAEAFRAWLDGREEGGMPPELGHCLGGTPLLARVAGQKDYLRTPAPWNAANQGTILLDARERTPGLVRDYVAGNIALIDGMPFVRMIGPMAYLTSGDRVRQSGQTMSLLNHPGGWTSNAAIARGTLFRFDRYADVHRMLGGIGRIKPAWDASELAGLGLREDDDAMLMLRESVRLMASHKPTAGYPLDKGRCEALEDYAALGSVGAIDPDDLPAAWRFVEGFCADLEGTTGVGWVLNETRRIRSYAGMVALPRLAERSVDVGEDAAFLGSLAPR